MELSNHLRCEGYSAYGAIKRVMLVTKGEAIITEMKGTQTVSPLLLQKEKRQKLGKRWKRDDAVPTQKESTSGKIKMLARKTG